MKEQARGEKKKKKKKKKRRRRRRRRRKKRKRSERKTKRRSFSRRLEEKSSLLFSGAFYKRSHPSSPHLPLSPQQILAAVPAKEKLDSRVPLMPPVAFYRLNFIFYSRNDFRDPSMLEIKGDCYLWVHDDGARHAHTTAGPRIVRFAILSGFRRIPPCLLPSNLRFFLLLRSFCTLPLAAAAVAALPISPSCPTGTRLSTSGEQVGRTRSDVYPSKRGRQERRPVDAKKVEYLARKRPRGTTLHEICHTYRLFRLVDAAGSKEGQREGERERERERENEEGGRDARRRRTGSRIHADREKENVDDRGARRESCICREGKRRKRSIGRRLDEEKQEDKAEEEEEEEQSMERGATHVERWRERERERERERKRRTFIRDSAHKILRKTVRCANDVSRPTPREFSVEKYQFRSLYGAEETPKESPAWNFEWRTLFERLDCVKNKKLLR